MPGSHTFAATAPLSTATAGVVTGAAGRESALWAMAKREESFVQTYLGRIEKTEFEFPEKLPPTLRIEIPEKAIQIALESIERHCRITPSRGGLRCVAKSGNAYIIKHRCGAVVAADSEGHYIPEVYIPSHDLYLQNLTLYKARLVTKKDGVRIICVSGLGYFAFQIDEKGNTPVRIENADLTDIRFIAYEGRAYEAHKADTAEIIESEGENANPHFLMDLNSSERFLFAVPKGEKVAPLTRRSYPSIGVITDKFGKMYRQYPIRIGNTDFFINPISEPTNYGDFELNGSGDHRNIKLHKSLPNRRWREASTDEIRNFFKTHFYAQINPASLKTPTVRHPIPATSEINEIGANLVAERIFTQAIDIFTPEFKRKITLQVVADERKSFVARRSRIVRMMSKSPIALFSSVKRIEIYPNTSTYYGFSTLSDVGGIFCSSKNLVRLFEFDRKYGEVFPIFLHEMCHSLHGGERSEGWVAAMLAIKSGGEKEFVTLERLTKSCYYSQDWGEFVAEAGASILSGTLSFEEFSEAIPFTSALIFSLLEKSARRAENLSTKQNQIP